MPEVQAHTTDMMKYKNMSWLKQVPKDGLDESYWKDSAGGCTFIEPHLDLFTFEVVWATERSCVPRHTFTHSV